MESINAGTQEERAGNFTWQAIPRECWGRCRLREAVELGMAMPTILHLACGRGVERSRGLQRLSNLSRRLRLPQSSRAYSSAQNILFPLFLVLP
jgi:hypothetical protein